MDATERSAYYKTWYKENKEAKSAYGKAWHNRNKNSKRFKYCSYRKSAKRREISFDISEADFELFWEKPCSYCGDSIETISLDRIDSSKGYSLDNIVSCCITCNRMKSDFNKEYFLSHIAKIAAFSKKEEVTYELT